MNEEHYNAVREAVIKAVPSLLDLKMGCEIVSGKTRMTILAQNGKEGVLIREDGELYHNSGSTIYDQIIGRPIRLADVLLTVNAKRIDLLFTTSFQFPERACVIPPPDAKKRKLKYPEPGYTYWNLRQDDLSLQSPETIIFLYNLLTP